MRPLRKAIPMIDIIVVSLIVIVLMALYLIAPKIAGYTTK